MKIRPAALFVVLCTTLMQAHADTVQVFLVALPSSVISNEAFWQLRGDVANPLNQTVFISALVDAAGTPPPPVLTSVTGSACFAIGLEGACNAAGELPLGPGQGAIFPLGALGAIGLSPGVYTRSLFIYGGFSGENDLSLIGSDTLTLIKTPEPGTFLLLGTGLLGVLSAARRRLRQ